MIYVYNRFILIKPINDAKFAYAYSAIAPPIPYHIYYAGRIHGIALHLLQPAFYACLSVLRKFLEIPGGTTMYDEAIHLLQVA